MIELRESHMSDGSIAVNVYVESENVGTVYVNLAQWDHIRELTRGYSSTVRVLNLEEARAADRAEKEES